MHKYPKNNIPLTRVAYQPNYLIFCPQYGQYVGQFLLPVLTICHFLTVFFLYMPIKDHSEYALLLMTDFT